MLQTSKLGNPRIQTVSLQFSAYMAGNCKLGGHAIQRCRLPARVWCAQARGCVTSYGPGVRSTAASAVAASASRIAAPSRALDSART